MAAFWVETLEGIDVRTAQFVLVFGVLLEVGQSTPKDLGTFPPIYTGYL